MTDLAFKTEPLALDTDTTDRPVYKSKEEVFTAVAKFIRRKNKRKVASKESTESPREGNSTDQSSDSGISKPIAQDEPKHDELPVVQDPPMVNVSKLLESAQEDKPNEQPASSNPGDQKPPAVKKEEPPKDSGNRFELQVVINTGPESSAGGEPPSDNQPPAVGEPKKPAKEEPKPKKPFVVAKPKEDLLALKNDEKPATTKKEAQPLKAGPPLLPNRNPPKQQPVDVPAVEEEVILTINLRSVSSLEQKSPKAVAQASSTSLPAISTATPRAEPKPTESKEQAIAGETEVNEKKLEVRIFGQAAGEAVDEDRYYYVKTPAVTTLLNDLKFLSRKQASDLSFEILSNNLEGSDSKKFLPTVFDTQTLFFLARSPYFKRLFKYLRLESNKTELLDGTKPYKKIIVRSPYNDDDSASAILNSYDPEVFGDGDLKLVPMELDEAQFSFRILPKISKKSFTAFMGYLQFGECQLEAEYLIDILKLSTLFETSELSALIEEHVMPTKHELLDNMEPAAVLELYYLANKNNLESLQRSCEFFINENDTMFVGTLAWREFLSRKPELVLKLFSSRA